MSVSVAHHYQSPPVSSLLLLYNLMYLIRLSQGTDKQYNYYLIVAAFLYVTM